MKSNGVLVRMEKKINPAFSICVGIVSFVILIIFDRVTKQWAVFRLKDGEPIILIRDVFQFYYLENHGAAFGILQGRQFVFIIITVVILAVIVYVYARLPYERKFRIIRILLVMISAGAIGNFTDRVMQNYVVDFFYFNLINFPVFNVADIYVTCATILLVLVVLFRYRDDDFTEIARSLKLKKIR